MTTVDPKAVQRAVNALVKATGVPSDSLSSIEIGAGGSVRVQTREQATFTVAHVKPFREAK